MSVHVYLSIMLKEGMQSMEKICEKIKSPINIHSQISAMIVRKVNDVCKKTM